MANVSQARPYVSAKLPRVATTQIAFHGRLHKTTHALAAFAENQSYDHLKRCS